jgi:L-aminopeptidase/D-esterase-like protein
LSPSWLHPGALTDVAGLRVGHAARSERATGCTVVLCPQGVVAGVAQRGGAPGTRETDLLRPENAVQQVHAVLLAGGSAFGLDAAGGVMRWLDEHGHGLAVGPARVPIVPAAVLFDLWLGDPRIRPDAATGYAACVDAHAGRAGAAPAQGSVGAGLGASVGKRLGITRAMRGGLGTASLEHGGFTVAALVAVNAVGNVLGEDGRVIAGVRTADGHGLAPADAALFGSDAVGPGVATTIGVVATDALLGKSQATQLAAQAHHGVARAVSPISINDGDTFFALATGREGQGPGPGDLTLLGALAAEAVSRAIRNAVRAATPRPDLPSAGSMFPG